MKSSCKGGGEATSPCARLASITQPCTHRSKPHKFKEFGIVCVVAQNAQGGDFIDSQALMYQLTINSPIEKGWSHQRIFATLKTNFKTLVYACLADEQGSMYHTHIFVVFSSRVRFSMMKRYFPEAHIERCKGTVSDNVHYVRKTGKWTEDISKQEKVIENTFEEYGECPPDTKGIRRDLSELYQMIANGLTNAQILALNQDYILQIDKLEKVRMILLADKFKDIVRLDLEVIYISGATSTGKTRGVLEGNGYSNVYRVTDYKHPFDSYNGQPVIAFDEFRSSLPIKEMLMYCDIYPIELPSRYTNKYACYNKVYIISNWGLEKQYKEVQKDDIETWEAFLRRIHKVVTYEKDGRINEYSSAREYMAKYDLVEAKECFEWPFGERVRHERRDK